MLNNAHIKADLRIPPANRLERLSGRRFGHYSLRINDIGDHINNEVTSHAAAG